MARRERGPRLEERGTVRPGSERNGGPRHGTEFTPASRRPVAGQERSPRRERDHRSKGAPWWIWLLLLLLAAIVLGMLLLGGGDSADETAVGSTNEVTAENEGDTSGDAGATA